MDQYIFLETLKNILVMTRVIAKILKYFSLNIYSDKTCASVKYLLIHVFLWSKSDDF